MISFTYTSDINGAIAEDPSIAGSIVQGLAGRMDLGTEAYAAAYELQRDAVQLQAAGISNPTVHARVLCISLKPGLAPLWLRPTIPPT